MKSIKFAEWLAQNHYRVINESKGVFYWISESDNDGEQTTKQLYKKFKVKNE
jgi:hypothetical protein